MQAEQERTSNNRMDRNHRPDEFRRQMKGRMVSIRSSATRSAATTSRLKRNIPSTILLVCLITLASCSTIDPIYHELGVNNGVPPLIHRGYIIGIEKIPFGRVSEDICEYDPNRFGFPSDVNLEESSIRDRKKIYDRVTTGQLRLMLTTHIFHYDNGNIPHPILNIYADTDDPDYQYEMGFDGLDQMFAHLDGELRSATENNTPISHIFLMSMGWNNDQNESIKRYNIIMNHIKQYASAENVQDFNLIVIGLTWPSVWGGSANSKIVNAVGHLTSYANKANDADEIGFTIANWVLNEKLLRLKDSLRESGQQIKIVVIGHSMGARLLSRAVFSERYLRSTRTIRSAEVDLFIGLQGAFSANRFIAGAGLEGSPYSDFGQRQTKVVLTSSKFDLANLAAAWSRNVGDVSGLNVAQSAKLVFDVVKWNGERGDLPVGAKVLMIDAQKIVRGGNAHNDILDKEMGFLIWSLVARYAN